MLVAFAGSLSTQSTPPKGATGKCKDGTYTMAATRKAACSKHGGVDAWLAGTAAAAPAGAPAGASAQCNDGTYSMSQHRKGTCSKHKGVKTWLKEIPA
ncbi:MAG TPA: DUF3761 domain-containing protein [Gemmatimonadales bacterium]|jgi:hypothetical protein|nr:DUF3761 domain-containing protein [Gemmatimonadales bacterium]